MWLLIEVLAIALKRNSMHDQLPDPESVESAISHYNKILQSEPNNPEAWHFLGYLQCQLERYGRSNHQL